jgi:hypothetical protein
VPRIGVGGPVGSGKMALVAALCRALSAELTLGVVATRRPCAAAGPRCSPRSRDPATTDVSAWVRAVHLEVAAG